MFPVNTKHDLRVPMHASDSRRGLLRSIMHGLAATHDTLCERVLRMVHAASEERDLPALVAMHEAFGAVYVQHSADERELFDELNRLLGAAQRVELSRRLSGL